MTDKNKDKKEANEEILRVIKQVKERKMQQDKRLYEQAKRNRKACGKFQE